MVTLRQLTSQQVEQCDSYQKQVEGLSAEIKVCYYHVLGLLLLLW